ncbi:LysR family transcriptional regulator [Gilvimarinus sp. SDUM040013]|uniref:LysR family transcriptional regulator n=1 Tax=Gilvimarinus gilvus TaxID=3058038 RepID=A0ABU4S3N9_9GAMM|nr:LysR family transcriptional regulator [Gilvimarinus sp. SDUM040013]MDO3385451.1 LysR family transcriptional regulator [Gilvimarinus sp. SDUM040013]MDX6851132.1 LysR family transcriptional regulator [Gilvimarinus sp. SDUM040013]
MDTFDGLKAVVAVVEAGSFTAAANNLGISKSLVSKYVTEVESNLGVRLFNRNSRSLVLTDAGHQYYRHARQLLEAYSSMVDEVITKQTSPRGLLRVSSPIAFGEHILARLLPKFSNLFPDIDVELQISNTPVNMLKDNIDVRIKSGHVDDSDMIARRLCDWPLIVCAAPSYLQANGTPATPQALSEHRCILDSHLRDGRNWTFNSVTGDHYTVPVHSNIKTNNPQALVNLVKAGGGIGLMAKHSVVTELANGRLVELFPEQACVNMDIFMIYPHRQHIPCKVQCFIDFMLQEIGSPFVNGT